MPTLSRPFLVTFDNITSSLLTLYLDLVPCRGSLPTLSRHWLYRGIYRAKLRQMQGYQKTGYKQ